MSQMELVAYRPVLFTVAYRMVGCAAVAEDMVQDTFFNWLKIDQRKINDARAYLIKSITNACINHLNSLKAKKEELIENLSPSLPAFNVTPDFSALDLKNDVLQALAQLQSKLPPAERAVYMLKEVFNFEYSELTSILGKKTENCRQLFSRAQQKLADEKIRFPIEADKLRKMAVDFKKATLGEFNSLIDNLKKDL